MDYDGWNTALADRFFSVRDVAAPVYLAVDGALLADLLARELGGTVSAPLAIDDFQTAIRSQITARSPFAQTAAATRRWRLAGANSHPPFVALLGATVLVASMMSRADGHRFGKFSYYGPLRQLMDLTDGSGMPDGYDDLIPPMWKELNWWLTEHEQGRRGLPSAIPHRTQVHIGWSLSQAVLLGNDRSQVGLFLSTIGAQPGDYVPEAELLARFEEWVRLSRSSQRIQRALTTPELRPILASILLQELNHYDGLARDAAGQPSMQMALTSIDGGAPFGLAVRIPSSFNHRSIQIAGDKTIAIPEGTEWLAFEDMEATAGSPLQINTNLATLTLTTREVYVFQPNETIGRWVSVNSAEIGVPHRVLVRQAYAAAAESTMRECGTHQLRRPKRVRVPIGWVLFTGYNPQQSTKAGGPLGPLSPLNQQLARLSGGLQISSGRAVYLSGYEPDIILPAAPDGLAQDITIDSIPLPQYSPPTTSGSTGIVRLDALALGAGDHKVQIGSRTITFKVVDRFRERISSPRLALPINEKHASTIPHLIPEAPTANENWTLLPPNYISGAFIAKRVHESSPPSPSKQVKTSRTQ